MMVASITIKTFAITMTVALYALNAAMSPANFVKRQTSRRAQLHLQTLRVLKKENGTKHSWVKKPDTNKYEQKPLPSDTFRAGAGLSMEDGPGLQLPRAVYRANL